MKKILKYPACFIGFIFITLFSCRPGMEYHKLTLIKTDESFSEFSKNYGPEKAFLEFLAEDAVLLRENSMPVKGIEQIKKIYNATDDSGFQLTWEPIDAYVSSSFDFGYTYGIYTLQDGEEIKKGTYVSIWRTGKDGRWELVLDTGNEGIGEVIQ